MEGISYCLQSHSLKGRLLIKHTPRPGCNAYQRLVDTIFDSPCAPLQTPVSPRKEVGHTSGNLADILRYDIALVNKGTYVHVFSGIVTNKQFL